MKITYRTLNGEERSEVGKAILLSDAAVGAIDSATPIDVDGKTVPAWKIRELNFQKPAEPAELDAILDDLPVPAVASSTVVETRVRFDRSTISLICAGLAVIATTFAVAAILALGCGVWAYSKIDAVLFLVYGGVGFAAAGSISTGLWIVRAGVARLR